MASRDLTELYFRLPRWLQHLAISAYGLKLRRQRYGGAARDVRSRLARTQWASKDRLRALQLDELNRVIAHAAATVPLYRERGLEPRALDDLAEIRSLPLLRKEDIQAPKRHVTSSERRGPVVEIHTGGTTGKPLAIYCDKRTLQTNYAFFDRFLEWVGVGRRPRTATFAGRAIVRPDRRHPPFWRRNLAGRQLLLSSYHITPETAADYVAELQRFGPDLIDSYPSSLRPLARHIVEAGGSEVRPKAIVTSSETLDPPTRQLLEDAFGCTVFDHYGAAEMAALITQCEHGSYHANPEFGVVEILRDGRPAEAGELGEMVATGFINPVMPLIRYSTGDSAVAGELPCACGRAFPVITSIEGRIDDVLITPDGRQIGRLDPIFKSVASVHETRIVQDRVDHVTVEVVPAGAFPDDEERRLRLELARRLGPQMKISVKRVSEIPRTSRGKLRAVVNEVRSGSEVRPE